MQITRDILDNLSTSIIALDSELKVVSLNSSCQDLLESSEGRALGQPGAKLVANAGALVEALERVRNERSPTSRRTRTSQRTTWRWTSPEVLMPHPSNKICLPNN